MNICNLFEVSVSLTLLRLNILPFLEGTVPSKKGISYGSAHTLKKNNNMLK